MSITDNKISTTMNSTQQQKIINWFVENDYKKVRVTPSAGIDDGSVEYECQEGLTTIGSYYHNGWRTTCKKGKKSDTKYLQIFIYTMAKRRIWVEEKIMFKIIERNQNVFGRYKLVSWKGWDNVDLMRNDYNNEYMNMLTALYEKHSS